MYTFEQFRQELRDALVRLYDPDYEPSGLLAAVIGCDLRDGAGHVQSTLIDTIKTLAVASSAAEGDVSQRLYDVLHRRFVLRRTQRQAADQLHMSPRHLRRVQREATHMLARMLWQHGLARQASAEATELEEHTVRRQQPEGRGPALDWRSQMKQELAALRMRAPGAVANVGETMRAATDLAQLLTARRGISVTMEPVEPNLIVPVHPSPLRQTLITAIEQLARLASAGSVTISADRQGEGVKISLVGPRAAEERRYKGGPIEELVASIGGSVDFSTGRDQTVVCIVLPFADEVTVLVVDDNLEMVEFYQRCVMGTRHRIIQLAEGRRTFELAEAHKPDIIVLDVMLPDIDGWELLAQLREHPVTRPIPVVVCSVIREEELALALGAAVYVAKPVRPRRFVQALDQAFAQAS